VAARPYQNALPSLKRWILLAIVTISIPSLWVSPTNSRFSDQRY
jgi:hypothetical protein